MKAPKKPKNELARLQLLRSTGLLDSPPEVEYDNIVQLASEICQTPVAVISLVDDERQWFKSIIGIEANESPRRISFCGHTILDDKILEIQDALKDKRFVDNPMVVDGPKIRFYAGAPLIGQHGLALGTLCVIDKNPKQLTDAQKKSLSALANLVMKQIELRGALSSINAKVKSLYETNDLNIELVMSLQDKQKELDIFFDSSVDMLCVSDASGCIRKVNPSFERVLGYTNQDVTTKKFMEFVHESDKATSLAEFEKINKDQKTNSFDIRFMAKDGSFRILNWTASPDRETGSVYAIARDVTDLKEQQSQLKETRELLAKAEKIAKFGSWEFKVSTGHMIWSEEQYNIFDTSNNLQAHELIFRMRAMIHADDVQEFDRCFAGAKDMGEDFSVDCRIVDQRQNNLKHVRIFGKVQRNHDGQISQIAGITQDRTAEVARLEELAVEREMAIRNTKLAS